MGSFFSYFQSRPIDSYTGVYEGVRGYKNHMHHCRLMVGRNHMILICMNPGGIERTYWYYPEYEIVPHDKYFGFRIKGTTSGVYLGGETYLWFVRDGEPNPLLQEGIKSEGIVMYMTTAGLLGLLVPYIFHAKDGGLEGLVIPEYLKNIQKLKWYQ